MLSVLGELAQLVERCDRTAEVRSSNLLFSILSNPYSSRVVSPINKVIQSLAEFMGLDGVMPLLAILVRIWIEIGSKDSSIHSIHSQ